MKLRLSIPTNSPSLIAVLAASCSVVSPLAAHAGIVYYENPAEGEQGHFNWHWQEDDDVEITFENWLDITRPSTQQFEFATGNSVGQLYSGSTDPQNYTGGGASVARADGTLSTRAFQLGEDISSASDFETEAIHVFTDAGIHSELPAGETAYIGVLTASGNYGWIAVIRGTQGNERYNLTTTGWAYETVPGKSILAGEIPAPASILPFVAFALCGAPRRRG